MNSYLQTTASNGATSDDQKRPSPGDHSTGEALSARSGLRSRPILGRIDDEANAIARRPWSQPEGPDMLKIDDRISIPLGEFRWDVSRSGARRAERQQGELESPSFAGPPRSARAFPSRCASRLMAMLAGRLTNEGELLVASQLRRSVAEPGRLPGQGPRDRPRRRPAPQGPTPHPADPCLPGPSCRAQEPTGGDQTPAPQAREPE